MLALALTLALAAPDAGLRAQTPDQVLEAVDRQEDFNDALEEQLDRVCGALKAGRRVLSPDLVGPGVELPVKDLVQLTACSLRALALRPKAGDRWPVRLLWDLDGRDADGRRVSVRSESDGAVAKTKYGLQLVTLDTSQYVRVSRDGRRFVERASAAGLAFPPRTAPVQPPELLSGGLTVRDVDGDGLPDVIAIDGPKLYLFHARGAASGPAQLAYDPPSVIATAPKNATFTSAATGDLDGDGDPDLVVTTFRNGPVRTFKNEGGRFVEGPSFGAAGWHQSAIPTDLDGDGKLDVVVLQYMLSGRVTDDFFESRNGEPPELWLGNGDLTFRRLPLPPAVARRRWSMGAVAAGLTGRGVQLYVANDYGTKDLFTVLPDGGVTETAAQLGLADPGNGMSADVGDLDGDGRLDLYVANMFSKAGTRVIAGAALNAGQRALMEKFARGNSLYLAQPDGGFEERAEALNVNRGLWAYGSLLADLDDDGHLEAVVANGYLSAPNRKDL